MAILTALDELRQCADVYEPVMLFGGTGRGKSWIAVNWEPERQNGIFQIAMTPQTAEEPLYGTKTIESENGLTVIKHYDGEVTQAYEKGGRLVVDEITTAPADISHMWHPIANGEPIKVKTDGYRTVHQGEKFWFVATSNLDGYGGNYRLSPAFYSRFHLIEWRGMSPDEETLFFADKFPTLDPLAINDIVEIGHSFQGKIGGNVEYEIGLREVRRTLMFAKAIQESGQENPYLKAFLRVIYRGCKLLAPDRMRLLTTEAERRFNEVKFRRELSELEQLEKRGVEEAA